ALDASTRFVASLVRSGGVARGRSARRLLEALQAHGEALDETDRPAVPEAYWSVRPEPSGPEGEEWVSLRGAVLVRVRGRRPAGPAGSGEEAVTSPELAFATTRPVSRPGRVLLGLAGGEGRARLAALVILAALVAGGSVVEAVLLDAAMGLGRDLGL